jgi:hypothetical protein
MLVACMPRTELWAACAPPCIEEGVLEENLTGSNHFGVQVQTPLEEAKKLSEQLGSSILLKREDLQPVRPPPPSHGS